MTRRNMVVLTPIAPAATGNGLAMRSHLLVEASGVSHDVSLVVIPVAGHQPASHDYGRGTVSVVQAAPAQPVSLVPWLSDRVWRERLERLTPVPAPVLAAAPALADDLVRRLPDSNVSAVFAVRLSLAPLGLALAERMDVPLIVDVDDDDADLLHQHGRLDEATAWERVAGLCLPAASLVTASSGAVAARLTARHGLDPPVRVVPNAVVVPRDVHGPAATPSPDPGRLLMVANFTYRPNIDGGRWLVREVLPLLGPRWSLDLVGSATPEIEALRGGKVEVHGWVPDVVPYYATATVAAVPLLTGSGTRIKLLEAMARGRPVVTTSVGAAGLEIRPGVHALLADDPASFAEAVGAATDPALARPLVAAATRLVRAQYDAPLVVAAAADLLINVTDP